MYRCGPHDLRGVGEKGMCTCGLPPSHTSPHGPCLNCHVILKPGEFLDQMEHSGFIWVGGCGTRVSIQEKKEAIAKLENDAYEKESKLLNDKR